MTDKKELERLRETQDRVKRNAEDMDTAANSKGRYFLDPGKAKEIAGDLRDYAKELDERLEAVAWAGRMEERHRELREAGQFRPWSDKQRAAFLTANVRHKSDCAVNNGPALPAGPCDCGAPAFLGYEAVEKLLAEGEAAQDGDENFRELVFTGRAMSRLLSIDDLSHWPACATHGDPAGHCDCDAQPDKRIWTFVNVPRPWPVPAPEGWAKADPRIVLQSKLDLALAAFKWDEGKSPPNWMWQCTMHGKPVVASKQEFRMRLGSGDDGVIDAVRARVQAWIDTWRKTSDA